MGLSVFLLLLRLNTGNMVFAFLISFFIQQIFLGNKQKPYFYSFNLSRLKHLQSMNKPYLPYQNEN